MRNLHRNSRARLFLLVTAVCFGLLFFGQVSEKAYLIPSNGGDPHPEVHKHSGATKTPSGSAHSPGDNGRLKTVSDKIKGQDSKPEKSKKDTRNVPFEEAVANEALSGWEEKWFSQGVYDVKRFGKLQEPKIDLVYAWVNGSDKEFADTKRTYELKSPLNDKEGKWLNSHGANRYRDWDELRYSLRSVEKHAGSFMNKIIMLVNNKISKNGQKKKQRPTWLKKGSELIKFTAPEDYFSKDSRGCLPVFNSKTIEHQLFNTKSDVDPMLALSDDMFLSKPHSASDIYSPLFGPVLNFKDNSYNTKRPPTPEDAERFGEKPGLIFSSWLLNRRFGHRKRRGQMHIGHPLSRRVMKEALTSFPKAFAESACIRFRSEQPLQLNPWFTTFHYTIERHREALLWSYLTIRADSNNDGALSFLERQTVLKDLEEGAINVSNVTYRTRTYFAAPQILSNAGLAPPKVNREILWTHLDGPLAIRTLECKDFAPSSCLGSNFSSSSTPSIPTKSLLSLLAKHETKCGDCLLKILLHRSRSGLEPLLPHTDTQNEQRRIVLKALRRYSFSVAEADALFVMMTDAEQIREVLERKVLEQGRQFGQITINDDVSSDDTWELSRLRDTLKGILEKMFPERSSLENVE